MPESQGHKQKCECVFRCKCVHPKNATDWMLNVITNIYIDIMDHTSKRGHDLLSPDSQSDSPPSQRSRLCGISDSPNLPSENGDAINCLNPNQPQTLENSVQTSEMADLNENIVKVSLIDKSAPDFFNKAMANIELMLAPLSKIENILTTVIDLKKSVEVAHSVASEAKSDAERCSRQVSDLQAELEESKLKQVRMEFDLHKMKNEISLQEDYTRRENLIFEGIPQTSDKEDLDSILKSKFKSMGIDDDDADSIRFDRIHRLNTKKNPKPVIARFSWHQDRQRIWDLRKTELKKYNDSTGSNLSMREDFSSNTMEKRSKLYPIMKAARNDPSVESAYLKHDKLMIDKRAYSVESLHTLPPALRPQNLAEKENETTLVFWGSESMLSNFYHSPFVIQGIHYNCVEQFLCCAKALISGDEETRQLILKESNPAKQKALGRRVRNFNSKMWGEMMKNFAEEAIRAKISQNMKIYDKLVSTRGKSIGEASQRDTVWGTGVGIFQNNALNKSSWKGQNILGELLVEIRENL